MVTVPGFRSNVPGSNVEPVDEDNPLPVQQVLAAALASGFNITSFVLANTINATVCKPLPGQVYGWALYNSSATVPFQVRLYDKNIAPVIATDIPSIRLRIGVPSTATGAGNNILLPGPVGLGGLQGFMTGISLVVVTAAAGALADTDAGAPAVGSGLINIFWL